MSLPTPASHNVTREDLAREPEGTFIERDGKISHELRYTKKKHGVVEKQRKPKKSVKTRIGEKLQGRKGPYSMF